MHESKFTSPMSHTVASGPVGAEFEMEMTCTATQIYLTMKGLISEHSNLRAKDIPPGRSIIIDTAGVERINSFGVREWTLFISALCEKSLSVVITNLSPSMVTQSSMVANFLDRASVVSYYTPWSCADCGHEELKAWSTTVEVPAFRTCPECNSEEMEFDDFRESYLAFLEKVEEEADMLCDDYCDSAPLPVLDGSFV